MNRRHTVRTSFCLLLALFTLTAFASAQRIAIEAETLHTAGPAGTIANGVVLIENGKIVAVGPAGKVKIPAGAERLQAKVVTPGFIDARSTVGLSGLYNVAADQDMDEATNPNTAEMRALDSFNPREGNLRYVLRHGVTTVQASPGDVNPIAGQAGVFKTHGVNVEAVALKKVSAMVFNLGERPKSVYRGKGRGPGTRMATAALIRKALLEAQEYAAKWKDWDESEEKKPSQRPSRDLKQEALARVTSGELPAIFIAHREDDILTAIRIGKEFGLRLMLAYATEGYLVREEIRAAGVPVLLGPATIRPLGLEAQNASLENAALLAEAGVPIAFSTGHEGYVPKNHVLIFEVGISVANGLPADKALRAATIDAARLLGVEDRVGSLEPGKDADLVLFDGDPFEYTSHVEAVLVDGQIRYRRGQ